VSDSQSDLTSAAGSPATPAADPTPAPVAPSGDGGADYHPSQDDAAALSIYREVKAHPADPPPEATPASPVDAPPLPVPGAVGAADDLSPEDKRLERILTRVTRLDEEHKTLQRSAADKDARIAQLEADAKFAADYRKELAEFQESPETFFKRVNWDQDKIRDYIVNGPKPVDAITSKLAREQNELKERLAKYEAAEAERIRAAQVNEYKATLPKALEPEASKYPLTLAFYDSAADLSDALFGQMTRAYQEQNRTLSPAEAAEAIESVLTAHHERLTRAKSKPGTPAAAPTATKTAPSLTNVPPASAKPPAPSNDSDSDDDLMAAAVQMLRSKRPVAA
jgi:hypothetical protein